MSDERSIELTIDVPGTPEEVWDAIATGPGLASWLFPVDMPEDGSRALAWEPPRRAVFQIPSARGTMLAQEWVIEAAAGGTCVVRMVHSGFGTDADWDDEFEGMSGGWRIFLNNLRLYLTHFRGTHAHTVVTSAPMPMRTADAWVAFCDALGVPSTLSPGDTFSVTAADGRPSLDGVVDHVTRADRVCEYTVLLSDGAGVALIAIEGGGEQVALALYLYLYGDDAEAYGKAWETWMAERQEVAAGT